MGACMSVVTAVAAGVAGWRQCPRNRGSRFAAWAMVFALLAGFSLTPAQCEGLVASGVDRLVNDNTGSTGTASFTQSETSFLAFSNTVVVGFNDSGSAAGGASKFTGFARSTDGGLTFADGGTLPTTAGGDAGDPLLALDAVSGRIYFVTLGFSISTIQLFRSDDQGVTWSAPVNATPGGASEDKPWLTVDNFPGPGQGTVYLMSRNFGAGNGIYLYRSTDGGSTFGPTGGTLIVSGKQGAFAAVGPDHAVYAFWYNGSTIEVRKSTDQGLTFGPSVTVVSGLTGGTNGDLGLTGIRQGTSTASPFRSNEFPYVAVNPVTGHVYVAFNDNPAGADKADVYLVMSTDGGATWSSRILVNDDGTTTDQWMPAMAVTPDGSRLGVFYYSRQEDPVDNNLFRYYGRLAVVAGPTLTFLPSFAVSDTPSLPEFGRDSLVNSVYMGDYNGAAATPGAFHVVWSDNRDDLPGGAPRKDPNVYYDKIPLGLAVASTDPASGSVVPTTPVDYVVSFTDPIDVSTVDAGDFAVNGIPATAFAINNTQQVTFSYAVSPVSVEGLQTMTMAAGSVLRDGDGNPLLEFAGTFRYDTVTLQVTTTVPPVGGTFALPSPLTYDVTFNEPVDAASVQAGDLALSGIAGASVTSVSVLAGNTTVRFTLDGIMAEGTLTVGIAAGSVTDVHGNAGASFSGSYAVDAETVPYPAPLEAEPPQGSLIYDPTATGTIGVADDTDSFTLAIDSGQTITLLVSPASASLQPTVELRDPSNTVIGSAMAGAPGGPALIQTAPAAAGGTYTFTVGGASGSTGTYTLRAILNAALETEGLLPGASNDTLMSAQDIDASFVALPQGTSRGAVTGQVVAGVYSAAAVPYAFEDISGTGTIIAGLTNQDDASVSIPAGFTFPFFGTGYTSLFVSSNGLITFGTANSGFTNSDLTTSPAQAAIAPFWDDQHTGGGQPASGVYYQVLGSGPSERLTIQWNQVRPFSGGTAGDTFTYQVQLFADGRIQLNYQDLVSGTAGGNDGASATVGIKAAGNQGPDRLLLAFNNGPNSFVGTGKSTLITPAPPAVDMYSFSLNSGETATLALEVQGSPTSTLDLIDSIGNVVAAGTTGATNVDRVIAHFQTAASGSYFARVGGTASTAYNLVVTRNAGFDTEPNDSLATAQDITQDAGVLGAIAPTGSYEAAAVPFTFEDISGTGTIIAGLTNQDDASVSIPTGFAFRFYDADYTSLFVSSNGLITFGGANSAFTNADLTSSPAQAAIAPFWDDQHAGGGQPASGVFYQVLGSGADQHLTVQWNQVRFFSGGVAGDTISYQAQLYIDGRIRLNYLDLVSGTAAGNNGASATVGIKATGTQGPDRLLLAFNNGPNAFVGTGLSTLITRPLNEDWYSINVTTAGTVLRVETSTPGDGPGEPVNDFDPHIELYDPAGTLVSGGDPLPDGRNESIEHQTLTTGSYRVRVDANANTRGEYFLSKGTTLAAATLTLAKTVTNNNGGTASETDWILSAAGPTPLSGVTGSGTVTGATVAAGVYTLSETGPAGYTPGSWACTVGSLTGDQLTLAPGERAVCTINNDDQPAHLTLVKIVINNNGGAATPANWTLSAAGPTPILGVSGSAAVTGAAVNAGAYALSETGPAGYLGMPWNCAGGVNNSSQIILGPGQVAVCTIVNDDIPPQLTVIKNVVNNSGRNSLPSDFTMQVTGSNVSTPSFPGSSAGTTVTLNSGAYSVGETGPAGYQAGYSSGCAGAIAVGETRTCTITNNDLPLSSVTSSSFCALPDDQFRLIYLQDPLATNGGGTNYNNYRLNASNPGQLEYNVFHAGAPGTTVTVSLQVPYPFVTQGSNPIQVHGQVSIGAGGCFMPGPSLAGYTVTTTNDAIRSPSGAAIIGWEDYPAQSLGATTTVTVSGQIPATGLLYVTVHLNHGLKGTTGWSAADPNNDGQPPFNAVGTSPGITILNPQPYVFSYSGPGVADAKTASSTNTFKKNPGVNGLTLAAGTGEPRPAVTVELWGPTGKRLLTAVTDQDGFYMMNYKHTGKAATYQVRVPAYGLRQNVTLKANGYAIVIFDNLP